jgi:hypothetical protein
MQEFSQGDCLRKSYTNNTTEKVNYGLQDQALSRGAVSRFCPGESKMGPNVAGSNHSTVPYNAEWPTAATIKL